MKAKFLGFPILLLTIGLLTGFSFGQTTFPGTGFGEIPDGSSGTCQTPGLPLDIPFDVTGFVGAPTSVAVSMTFNPAHTFGGDVVARLYSPDGTNFVIFGYTGATTAAPGGDGTNLDGPYTFSDIAAGDWWGQSTTLDTNVSIPAGSYRTSAIGGGSSTGAFTDLSQAFASIPASNGTWFLRFADGCNGDTGSVSDASLTLTGQTGGPSPTPTPSATPEFDAITDVDGDGASDFLVIRDTTGSSFGRTSGKQGAGFVRERMKRLRSQGVRRNAITDDNIQWLSRSSATGNVETTTFGDIFSDEFVPADFDGDYHDDIAVWRSTGDDATTGFYWLSSLDNTTHFDQLGTDGDFPYAVGDYDGDGIDDPTIYRCPLSSPGPCFFIYKKSSDPGAEPVSVRWGNGVVNDFLPCLGDYDGDGRQDPCIFRPVPGNTQYGQFAILLSSGGMRFANFGFPDYFQIPGDFNGDGKSDFALLRQSDGLSTFYIKVNGSAPNDMLVVNFGNDTDLPTPGDFDGDGKQDIAVWRPDTGKYWIRQSRDGIVVEKWGEPNDIPVQSLFVY